LKTKNLVVFLTSNKVSNPWREAIEERCCIQNIHDKNVSNPWREAIEDIVQIVKIAFN